MGKNRFMLAILLACALGASACVTVGHRFNYSSKTLQEGKTTQAEALELLGQPFRVGVDSGDDAWTYVDYHFSVFGKQKATDLILRWGKDGLLKSYTYNSTEP